MAHSGNWRSPIRLSANGVGPVTVFLPNNRKGSHDSSRVAPLLTFKELAHTLEIPADASHPGNPRQHDSSQKGSWKMIGLPQQTGGHQETFMIRFNQDGHPRIFLSGVQSEFHLDSR